MMKNDNNERLIIVETTCGQTFKQYPSEMTDWQLAGLLEQNPDGDPLDIAALRGELQRRAE
jgi:hypothetical protein